MYWHQSMNGLVGHNKEFEFFLSIRSHWKILRQRVLANLGLKINLLDSRWTVRGSE